MRPFTELERGRKTYHTEPVQSDQCAQLGQPIADVILALPLTETGKW